MILPREFYIRTDVVEIARELLGKLLVTRIDGVFTSGLITETEAYAGVTDRASHAYEGRRSARTEVMYRIGGTAYVYLCYGIHSLFNVVTNDVDIPHAVLIRGIRPVDGMEQMLQRTGKKKARKDFANGPGKISKILGINFQHTGLDLMTLSREKRKPAIWIETGETISTTGIISSSRIGINYAEEDAKLLYRFLVK
ncbi:MAG: DNA-3-methyladenine glycosylase [Bacteroidales bacterium]|nr:DNA-3-methyladenine glycosylase [Bacteroidota bacterium]MBL6949464.1 DNA-3-methyladenine glycosylase [Bacteroidales bacterium]